MVELAFLLHWPPAVLDAMPTDELLDWRDRAVQLHNRINAPADA